MSESPELMPWKKEGAKYLAKQNMLHWDDEWKSILLAGQRTRVISLREVIPICDALNKALDLTNNTSAAHNAIIDLWRDELQELENILGDITQ